MSQDAHPLYYQAEGARQGHASLSEWRNADYKVRTTRPSRYADDIAHRQPLIAAIMQTAKRKTDYNLSEKRRRLGDSGPSSGQTGTPQRSGEPSSPP
jgi:hypothetical protein